MLYEKLVIQVRAELDILLSHFGTVTSYSNDRKLQVMFKKGCGAGAAKEPLFPRVGAAARWVSFGSNSGFSFWQLFKNLKIVIKTQIIRSRMLICEFLLNF